MANLVTFHEFYGEVTPSLLRTIKRFNVSPMDFQELVDHSEGLFHTKLGQLNAIERTIKSNVGNGRVYRAPWPLEPEIFSMTK